MLLSIYLPQEVSFMHTGDPGRIAAQVVSGIGFLGAGAIIRLGNNVRGLTTAASLWFAAAVGLSIGAGMFIAAGVAEATGLFTRLVLGKFERKIFPAERLKILEIYYDTGKPKTAEALEAIKSSGIRLQSTDVFHSSKSKKTKLKLLASIPNTLDLSSIVRSLKSLDNVVKVEIKEKY
jgi:putative Mg2+ transporter-C (MgtC) family protein